MQEIALVLLAGILGGVLRTILGFLGESEPDEKFSLVKAGKTLLRAVIGGGILAYFLNLDPKAVFFAAFLSDVATKNVWDVIKEKTR